MSENILENIYDMNMKQLADFQKEVIDNVVEMGNAFDPAKTMEQMMQMQDDLISGIKTLMDITPDDTASDQLEKEVVFGIGKMKLLHYKPLVAKSKISKTPTLIVYALVNRQYMMDLQPDRSMIKAFLDGGMDVYVIDWGYPTGEDMYMTLDDHINWYMDDCVNYILGAHPKAKKINLLGVCQGGTFSTIYTALHPDKVKNLVTMVVPIDFSTNDALLFRWGKHMNVDSLIEAYGGVVPGDSMNIAFLILKPLDLILNKYVGMVGKMSDKAYLSNFVRMEQWVFDSPAQAGATLSQFVKDMYQDNKLIKGELELGGKKVDLKNITCPLLVTCGEYDHLVPLAASRPILDAVGSEDKEFLSFKTGHIGMYTSSKSQKMIAPHIVEWVSARS